MSSLSAGLPATVEKEFRKGESSQQFSVTFHGNTKMECVFIQNSSVVSPGSYSAGVLYTPGSF